MALDISVTANGEKRAEQTIKAIGDRGQNMKPALDAIAGYLLDTEERHFQTRGKYGGLRGSMWAPLKPSTLLRKKREGKPLDTPLRDSGALMESLSRRGASGQRLDIKRDSLRLGSELEYADYMVRGSRSRPRRKIMVWTRRETNAARKTLAKYAADGTVERPRLK